MGGVAMVIPPGIVSGTRETRGRGQPIQPPAGPGATAPPGARSLVMPPGPGRPRRWMCPAVQPGRTCPVHVSLRAQGGNDAAGLAALLVALLEQVIDDGE